jgi:hypothetical protein
VGERRQAVWGEGGAVRQEGGVGCVGRAVWCERRGRRGRVDLTGVTRELTAG